MNMMMRKAVRKLAAIFLTLCLGVFIASVVGAADYSFGRSDDSDYYPSTDYEDVYGSYYQ